MVVQNNIRSDNLMYQINADTVVPANSYTIEYNLTHGFRDDLGSETRRTNFVEGDPLFVSLSRQNRGDRLGLRSIRGMVKRRYQDAGVVGKRTTHSLRHSAITNANRGRYAATGANDGAPFLV